MEQWIELRKSADFQSIAKRFGIDPVIARIIRNRELITEAEIDQYLNGTMEDISSPHLMKDMDRAVAMIKEKIEAQKTIRIIGDYDIDGVSATYILVDGLRRLGARVDYGIPHRVLDGYGLNRHLIELALEDGIDTIITCDNGISAIEEIAFAKSNGITVIVTDHHEIPYEEGSNGRVYKKSEADGIINPKQEECPYPFKGLCGAAVAYQLIRAIYEAYGRTEADTEKYIENVAFATIGDVMDLQGENRILVKEGLKRMRQNPGLGLEALMRQNDIEISSVNAYHIGFVLGPCINASGRLDTAELAMELLLAENVAEAADIASKLKMMNDDRKALTQQYLEQAYEVIETEGLLKDVVLVVYLPECHESLAGIIAGRIRERYYHPVFVLTRGEECVKGSGRSIEGYSMYDEMVKVSDLFLKFGGHPMAAGLSLPEDKVLEFRRRINDEASLTLEDLVDKIRFEMVMPMEYARIDLAEQLTLLEPFGKGNGKPIYADREIHIREARIVGKNQNVIRLSLSKPGADYIPAVFFGGVQEFMDYFTEKYGEEEVTRMRNGKGNSITMSALYELDINEYNGERKLQIVIRHYRC